MPRPSAITVVLGVLCLGATDPGAGSENPRARAALLDRVHRYWVQGVLEQALHQQRSSSTPPWT